MFGENEYEEQETLLPPVLCKELGEQKLEIDLLRSKNFCSLIQRFDNSDNIVKSLLLENLKPNAHIHYFEVS